MKEKMYTNKKQLAKSELVFETQAGRNLTKELLDLGAKLDLSEDYMNIIGLRNSTRLNKFDDYIGVIVKYGPEVLVRFFPATTTPGTPYLLRPINKKGTAILPEGFYKNIWRYGKHKGYSALQQNKPLALYRDNNKDSTGDYINKYRHSVPVGINLHRASKRWTTTDTLSLFSLNINRWSAGCQVIASFTHFSYFMWFARRHRFAHGTLYDYFLTEYDTKSLTTTQNGRVS